MKFFWEIVNDKNNDKHTDSIEEAIQLPHWSKYIKTCN